MGDYFKIALQINVLFDFENVAKVPPPLNKGAPKYGTLRNLNLESNQHLRCRSIK